MIKLSSPANRAFANSRRAPALFLLRLIAILWAAGPRVGAQNQTNVNVLTYHNDLARTGQNLNETVLTPANVNASSFGQLFTYPLDGWVFTQPLYFSGLAIPGQGVHNVVYIATEHDSVYAFDADSNQGSNANPLWQTSFINPAAGLTTVPMLSTFGFDNPPELGITGTPVIDPTTGTLFVVAKIQQAGTNSTQYFERLYALDIQTGAVKFGGPVDILPSLPGSGAGSVNGQIQLDPLYEFQRSALLLYNGVVYVSFASQGDIGPYHGWIVGYDANTLELVRSFNDTPNGYQGGIWMAGAAPAVDAGGNIYCMTGNGTFDGPAGGDYGDSFLKLVPSMGSLVVTDYFAPYDQAFLADNDGDLGSGAPMLLPDSAGSEDSPHLIVGGGKEGIIYLLDRDNLGQYNLLNNNQIVQSVNLTVNLTVAIFSMPAYFNNWIYFCGTGDYLKAFSISNAQMSSVPVSQAGAPYGFPGATPSISANGANSGIVWAVDAGAFNVNRGPGVLHAYNAGNLAQDLYNSAANPLDQLGMAQKFAMVTVANGKVYVASAFGLSVFGNLGAPFITTQPQSQTVQPGANVSFYVAAGGASPLNFQWQYNGFNIEEQTNSWLTLSNVGPDDAGPYTMQVGNSLTNVTSATAALTVNSAPAPPQLSIDSQLRITLQGVVGQSYLIQYTTDLNQGAAGWIPLVGVTLALPAQTIEDPGITNQPRRFYRALAEGY